MNTEKNTDPKNEKAGQNILTFMVVGLILVATVVAIAFASNVVIANPEDEKIQQVAADETDKDKPISFDMDEGPSEPIEVGDVVIKPGNPVVAKIGDENITRADVLRFIAQLPPQMRQQPLQDIFPLALNQTINARILEDKAMEADIQNDEEVKKELEVLRKNIIRTAYVQKLVEKDVTDSEVKKRYDAYIKEMEPIEEIKASHILVKDEAKAEEIIGKLEEGADFAELAKAESSDNTAQNGGDLGYFTKGQMVPQFSEAAFSLKAGSFTKEPVQTPFGYHVILVEEKRVQPKPDLEELRPLIETEIKRDALDAYLQAQRDSVKIEEFDINGEPAKTSDTSVPVDGDPQSGNQG